MLENISNPGKHLISPSKAVERNPDFFNNRPEGANWILRVKYLDGTVKEMPLGVNWEAISRRFGRVVSAVVTDEKGMPSYDRPKVEEAPNVNIVAYGKDKKTGELRIVMISQARPHADDVFDPNNPDEMVFEQIPMGFLEKVIGKDMKEKFESVQAGAIRETDEETGAGVIKSISRPEFPAHYPNPTFIGTASDLVFVEVDLDQINKMKLDRKELIFNADYIPLKTLIQDIKNGKTDRGYARMATSNSAILIFLSGLKTFQNAQRNEKSLKTEGQANKQFKKEDPSGYAFHRLRVSKIRHPEEYKVNRGKVEDYLGKLVKERRSL